MLTVFTSETEIREGSRWTLKNQRDDRSINSVSFAGSPDRESLYPDEERMLAVWCERGAPLPFTISRLGSRILTY